MEDPVYGRKLLQVRYLYLYVFMQICTNKNCILYIDVFWLRAECTLSKSGI